MAGRKSPKTWDPHAHDRQRTEWRKGRRPSEATVIAPDTRLAQDVTTTSRSGCTMEPPPAAAINRTPPKSTHHGEEPTHSATEKCITLSPLRSEPHKKPVPSKQLPSEALTPFAKTIRTLNATTAKYSLLQYATRSMENCDQYGDK